MTMTGGAPGGDWAEVDDLDIWTADRLLDGHLARSEAPDGYERVAMLIGVVKEGVAPASSGWGSPTVPAMARRISAPARSVARRRRSRAWRVPHAAAVVVVVGALSAGTAAAATGSLPEPVQSVIHSAGSAIGVPIPAPDVSQTVRSGPGPGSGSSSASPVNHLPTFASPVVVRSGAPVRLGPAVLAPSLGARNDPADLSPSPADSSGVGDATTPAEGTSPDSQPPTTDVSTPSQDVIPPAVTPTTQPPTTTSTIPSAAHGRGQGSGGGQAAGSPAHGGR